ncbi:MAG: MCE family protein [Bacteroidia bacterium]|nr:MCE family protein [Bacteroidia bacterium]
MSNKTANNTRLGLFVSLSIALLITGIYFIGKKQQLFGNTFIVNSVFKDISGLQIGNNVRYSGINVGIIDNIEQITDTTVKVEMLLDESTRKYIRKNAKAIIGSDGLMGNKIVVITPGTPDKAQLANNDNIQTAQAISLDDILLKIKISSDNAADITTNLGLIVRNISNGKGTVGKLFMDTVFAENINQTLINIKQGAGGFDNNMKAASKSVFLRGFFKKKKK